MHPFYGPSARLLADKGSSVTGLVSMAAYLAFWAGAVALGWRELNARFPRGGPPGQPAPAPPARDDADPALSVLRERYARGEIDQATFRQIRADLEQAR